MKTNPCFSLVVYYFHCLVASKSNNVKMYLSNYTFVPSREEGNKNMIVEACKPLSIS